MKRAAKALFAAVLAALSSALPAHSQANFPQVMPADTVYGSQFVSGPGQAIAFSVLAQRLASQFGQSPNTFSALQTFNFNTAPAAPGALPSGSIIEVMGADNGTARINIDAFGSGSPVITMRRAEGTAASPSAVQSGDSLMQINARGYGATGYSTNGSAYVQAFAAENWTDSAQGAYLSFGTALTGSPASSLERMRIFASGGTYFGSTPVDPGTNNAWMQGALNITSLTTYAPGVRAPLFIWNNPSSSAAGHVVGTEIWIGNNPTATPGLNNFIAQLIYIDNLNSRGGIWADNAVCLQASVASGGSTGIVHCKETDVFASIAPTTATSAYSAGSVVHAQEFVASANANTPLVAPQVASWVYSANDISATQAWWQFGYSCARVNLACVVGEVIGGDTGTAFTQGLIWDKSNSAATMLVAGTHTSIIDTSGATYTQFANCNATCGFTGKLSSSGGFVTTGNAGAIGLGASVVANALSGNPGYELQTNGTTRGYLAATSSLMELYTNSAIQLKLGTNNTDAIIISGTQVIQVPAVATGTPAASLCIDASNNIIKKTTTGPCV